MLKENSSISMKELFSSFADKEKRGTVKKITNEEKKNFLKEKKEVIDNLSAALIINDEKKEIIDEASSLNYDKSNINKFVVGVMTFMMLLKMVAVICVVSLIVANAIVGIFLFSFVQKDPLMFNLWLFSISTILLTGFQLKRKKTNFMIWLNEKMDLNKESISKISKLLFLKKSENTIQYITANFKAGLYYENKIGNDLYDSFLLEEIHKVEDDGLVLDWPGNSLEKMKNKAISQANQKYEEYNEKKEDLDFLEKILK